MRDLGAAPVAPRLPKRSRPMQPKRFRSPIESQQAGSNRMSWLDAKMSTEAYPSQIRSVHKRAPPNVRPSVETSHHHLEHTFPGRRLSVCFLNCDDLWRGLPNACLLPQQSRVLRPRRIHRGQISPHHPPKVTGSLSSELQHSLTRFLGVFDFSRAQFWQLRLNRSVLVLDAS
jgi:hypothetical protein